MKQTTPSSIFAAWTLLLACSTQADVSRSTAADLIELDFEELVNMDVEVQTAGKVSTRAMDLPYAAFVVSTEDIQRSGVQTIPDALRMVPGVSVKQISSAEWAIGIRGAGGRFSRFVLVMVDGRIAYNNVFSGVNWDELNITLSQIDRIEVVRGPNAAAWGANAVNGIINIITRVPSEGKPPALSVWGGSDERAGVSAAYDTKLGDAWSLSLAAHAVQWDGLISEQSQVREPGHEDWRVSSSLLYKTETQETKFTADRFVAKQAPAWRWIDDTVLDYREAVKHEQKDGWAFQLVHQQNFSESGYWKVRGSAERTERGPTLYEWDSLNYQLDAELSETWGNHQFSAGINTRMNDSEIIMAPEFLLNFSPERRKANNYGIYLSDSFNIIENLELTLSARMDYSELSSSNLQPSIRVLWRPSERQRFWFAASEATTTPSRALLDIPSVPYVLIPEASPSVPLPILIEFNSYKKDEEDTRLRALELGYRQTFERFNIDIALFDFDYSNEITLDMVGDIEMVFSRRGEPTHFLQKAVFTNEQQFSSRGGELSFHGQLNSAWSAQLAYSRVQRLNEPKGWSSSFSLMNTIDLRTDLRLNLWFRHRHSDAIITAQPANLEDTYGAVDDYLVMDSNITWDINSQWRLELMAKNLGDAHTEGIREEFSAEIMLIEPSAIIRASYQF